MKVKAKIETLSPAQYLITVQDEDDYPKAIHFSSKNENNFISFEGKRWHPPRTITQNAFFHKTCSYLAFEIYRSHDEKYMEMLKEGIKTEYGYKEKDHKGKLVNIPTHLCDTIQMGANIEGLFLEAGEQSIDMGKYISDWQKIKNDRMEKL